MSPPLDDALYLRAGVVFTPSAPVRQKDLFAGRMKQIAALLDTLGTPGQHAVVYGERGVGKTSLVSTFGAIVGSTNAPLVRENCHADDTYARIWSRALESVETSIVRKALGFTDAEFQEVKTLLSQVMRYDEKGNPTATPDEVVRVLRKVHQPIVFVFDEFDQLTDESVSRGFAETIKALSDYVAPVKVVLVGVADSVDSLISAHGSIERALRQIRMPRMAESELVEFINKATEQLGMTCAEDAKLRLVRLSQGLPHYAHLLGLHSVRHAIVLERPEVNLASLDAGIAAALDSTEQSHVNAYLQATSSNRPDALFKQVLLACALAEVDDRWAFTSGALRVPLKAMGHPMAIPAYAGHLNKFTTSARGPALRRLGGRRQYRYRFMRPLLQPYVVLRSISENIISAAAAEKLLAKASGEPGHGSRAHH